MRNNKVKHRIDRRIRMNRRITIVAIFLIVTVIFGGLISVGAAAEGSQAVKEVRQESLNDVMEILFPSDAFFSEPSPEIIPVGSLRRKAAASDNNLGKNIQDVAVMAFMVQNTGTRKIFINKIVVSEDSSPGISLTAPFGFLSRKDASMNTCWTKNGGLPLTSTINFNTREMIGPGQTAEIEILVGVYGAVSGDTLKINLDNITWSDGSGSKFAPTRTESVYIAGDIIKFP